MIDPSIRRRPRGGLGFSLVELMVVIAVVALLVALLFPALQRARGQANRALCMANQRQMHLAATAYTADWDGIFPTHGAGQFPTHYLNVMRSGPHLRDNYAGGNRGIWHCPVARPYYSTPTWKQAIGEYSFGHSQFGYMYFGGWGSADTRKNYVSYYGWYNQIYKFDARGRRMMPTYSLTEADQLGNASQRPLFMDINQLDGVPHLGGGNSFRTYPNPAHGPALGAISGTDENIVFVDGHGEAIFDPLTNYRYRTSYLRW